MRAAAWLGAAILLGLPLAVSEGSTPSAASTLGGSTSSVKRSSTLHGSVLRAPHAEALAIQERLSDPWQPIRFMVGDWEGTSEGRPGAGTVRRTYAFVLGDRYLHEKNVSTYPSQERNPAGDVHEHWSFFSHDRARGALVLRQFHQEGFVNQYVLDRAQSNGPKLVFESENFENLDAAWRARETYEIVSENEFTETFELAAPGKPHEVYSRNRFKRSRARPGDERMRVLQNLEGQEARLSDYGGQIVVLNFWATWCAPCLEELPELARLQRRYGARGLQVIAASADEAGSEGNVAALAAKLNLRFPIWTGAAVADMEGLGLGSALPATAILDREGNVVGRILGAARREDLEAQVGWLLGDRSEAPEPMVNRLGPEHPHGEEEDHTHGAVTLEGASTVPS
jgi:thiol-disulfide isomerase/thioredoxin